LTERTDGIRTAYTEYRSAFKSKEPIKLAYVLGFLSVTLASSGGHLGRTPRFGGITVPIGKLAEGTVQVAQGNLDYRVEEKSGDEVGMLVEYFNRMTADLKGSREQLRQEGEYKTTILSNIDTGVISMDRGGKITTVNAAAVKILGTSPSEVLDRRYDEAFRFIDLAPVRGLFRDWKRDMVTLRRRYRSWSAAGHSPSGCASRPCGTRAGRSLDRSSRSMI